MVGNSGGNGDDDDTTTGKSVAKLTLWQRFKLFVANLASIFKRG